MRHNIKYIIIGTVAFIFALTASSVIGTVVNALIPNPNKVDPEGKLDEDPQKKSKAEWLQQLEGGGPAKTQETKTKSTPEPTPEPAPQPVAEPAPVFQPVNPAVAPPPPTPRVGPGNFDAPQPYTPPPAPRTGPGNM
jgi:hypothetical protein